VLIENGYNILLANTRDQLEEELRYLNLFYEKRVDGILYFATGVNEQHAQVIAKLRMPVVIVGQSGEFLNCPSVRLDSFEGARAMVNYLVSLGHRRIGCLAVPDHDINVGTLRKEGYYAALRENGIETDPSLVITGDFEYESGEAGSEKLMGLQGEKPTAIYCITDRLAVSASGWLLRNGYRVPEDVSVACIDDPALLSFCYPSITTMSFDYRQTGILAGRMIVDCIDGIEPEPYEVVMPFTMKIRGSTSGTSSTGGSSGRQ
jgi:DNA-binding LacI/PurR family transcriptional regulator